MTIEQAIVEKLRELPAEKQREVLDFVEFLRQKGVRKPMGKPRFDWAGALGDLRNQYTSVELQHKASEWRTEEG